MSSSLDENDEYDAVNVGSLLNNEGADREPANEGEPDEEPKQKPVTEAADEEKGKEEEKEKEKEGKEEKEKGFRKR